MRTLILLLGLILSQKLVFGQTAILIGSVRDANTQVLLPGVSVVIDGSNPLVGAVSDQNGDYRIVTTPGSYTLKVTYVGYQELKKFNVVVSSGNTTVNNFDLLEELTTLNEVVVKANRSSSVATIENPLSIQSLSSEEIKSNPGGNFDISRVVQSLPGVSTSAGGVRNDIIIRGGAPNENVYYLDGIEVPVINHFTTQGSAGGPQGILNVSFLEDVTLSTSGFQAKYDNALSSVFQFTQRNGNTERLQGNIRLSGTELALTADGPISPKTTFLASARRSYLQVFFKLIDLPIRPNYWDFQYKVTHRFNEKTTLTAIGIGAIDEFSFAVPKETSLEKEYVLRSNPLINQNSYTTGFSLKHLITNGYFNVALSRNQFNNRLDKFEDGQTGSESARTLRSRSDEVENKLRIDLNQTVDSWKYSFGATAQYVQFSNDLFAVIRKEIYNENSQITQPGINVTYSTNIDFLKYGVFGQVTKSFLKNRLSMTTGLRTDMNTFTIEGDNPIRTLSPRTSLSYTINNKWNLNASVGRYYKIPVYTVLGFIDSEGDLANRDNKYIQADHYVGGVEFVPNDALRFTAEAFYKKYDNYPISTSRGVSLANDGAAFTAIGNEDVSSNGEGRTYGVELFAQKKLTRNIFYIISYTWYRSKFSDANGNFVSSSWDNQNLVSALFGKKFRKGWELGLKFRYAGGAPFTPLDLEASRLNYLSLGTGVRDTQSLNSQRLDPFSQVDLRVDKKWNYRRFTFNLYLDVQNLFLSKTPGAVEYTFERNANGSYKTTDGESIKADGANAIPVLLQINDPFFVPTIGFIVEF